MADGERRRGVRRPKVAEAALAYRAEVPDAAAPLATARISAKNQITLPVALMRALGLKPGDELQMLAWGDTLTARKRLEGRKALERLYGSTAVPEWGTARAVDAYVRRERESWDRDA
ncbi:MAG TPA: AbrB/MazE/SpoVT family DNA-binding domain-containing protein [Dehalococcoidia bacterium]|nr:AbrB/MazE/SpoVT family DNA-binding domain-containing protein [Dehalococcoidia bacterium]